MLESERVLWKELLERYKEIRYLWDNKDKHYQSKSKRAQGYQALLQKYLEIDSRGTIAVLKKRLDNMRTSYQRERKKVKQSIANGDAEPYEPTLWYYEDLLFLEDPQPYAMRGKRTGESLRFNFNRSQNKIYLEKHSRQGLKRSIDSSSSESREVTQGFINIEPLQSSEEDTPQRHTSRPKRRIYNLLHKQEKFIDVASKMITKKEKDWEVIGKAIGLQLSALEHDQQNIAQKLISDAIYFGNLGKLNVDSFINVESFDEECSQSAAEIREQDPVIYEETASPSDNKDFE